MALETTVEQVEGHVPVTVVTLDGELDASSYEHVIETVRAIYEAGTRYLLLDSTGLSFISSSGLVALHSSLRLMHGEAPPDPEHGWAAIRAIGDDVEGGRPSRTSSRVASRMPCRRCSIGPVSVGSSRPIRTAPRRSRRSDPPRGAGVGGHDDFPG